MLTNLLPHFCFEVAGRGNVFITVEAIWLLCRTSHSSEKSWAMKQASVQLLEFPTGIYKHEPFKTDQYNLCFKARAVN